ncbi:MAG: preprotein translocase subunit SecA [Clostridia bacterium]|nr:preprotein translocase subunit SecA [Clostridia bacterium]
MGLFKAIFGDYSEREIKKLTPIVDKIESLADAFRSLTDEEMREYTDKLKDDLKEGKTLDDILPEAFALVREADDRVLGKRPFRVQLMGGILLHQGRIAEMKTGEGKTLVATLPAYLNALSGKGVHIVTVNDYLARRDSEEMGKVYAFLGLTTGLIVHGQEHDEKKAQYDCDITYATNNELGFDYLRDNMVVYKEDMVQRGHNFAIVDEVDSILIDEARTPLIISGRGEKSTELYDMADRCVRGFKKFVIKEIDAKADNDNIDADYIVDEKARTAVLTKSGIEKAERFFNIDNLSDPENSTIYHHVNTAIKAHGVMQKDVEYIIKDGAIVIVDTFTGRLMPGRRYNEGLHQAIEAKEHVDIQKESRTIATITFQNYFRMYAKLSGMTGTAMTEEDEFKQIYALDVVEVPTNKPMIRIDRNDVVYRSVRGKYLAIVEQIKACNEKGQPVLVGTVSIDKSELLSDLLKRNGIKHNVLNAKQHAKEAEIVAQAGRFGAVTISTNMAGRGTDIMLGGNPEFMAKNDMRKKGYDEEMINLAVGTTDTDNAEILDARALFRELYEKHKEEIRPEADRVREAGGLFILGTERHESRRIDNQLRGRSGRQGDPGESRFFLSLEDDLLRLFGSDKMIFIADKLKLPESTPLDSRMLSARIEGAQKRIEANNFSRRKHVLTYDDVMNQQRKLIYKERAEVLFNDDISEKIKNMIVDSVSEAFSTAFGSDNPEEYDFDGFKARYRGILTDSKGFNYTSEELDSIDKEAWLSELTDRALAIYASKDELYSKIPEIRPDAMREMEKRILLSHVDKKWMDHLEAMDEIKEYVGLNSYAQRDPVAMYRIESSNLFDEMIHEIKEDTVKDVLSHTPVIRIAKRAQVAKPITAGFEGGGSAGGERRPATSKKVGRNDPCPCGSGKKYKKCCGQNDSAN